MIKNMQALTVESDVMDKIYQIKNTAIVRRPRPVYKLLRNEIKEANMRIQKIKNGYPLVEAIHTDFKDHQYDSNPQITAPRQNGIPITTHPEYYFPDGVGGNSLGDKAYNQLEGLKYRIFEEDRARINNDIAELNLRNRRREKALKEEYQVYVNHGLTEARLFSKRSARLSSLKTQKVEGWWAQFLSSFNPQTVTPEEIKGIEIISKTPLNEPSLYDLACSIKGSPNKILTMKKLLLKANEIGKFSSSYWISETFKCI